MTPANRVQESSTRPMPARLRLAVAEGTKTRSDRFYFRCGPAARECIGDVSMLEFLPVLFSGLSRLLFIKSHPAVDELDTAEP